ncbi:MAG: sensor histidine kinase [Zhengella sp.]|uniref:stimulus-sensing domain-containing protein n=1 Tax=Zhengella sp. TaxID=2282762 RepID=UPI001DA4C5A2|nr:sensor histidine kinase [Notoacmeibacter sp.]MCC0025737.1 sensor histidine kinase [Brucellaceae bacterium]
MDGASRSKSGEKAGRRQTGAPGSRRPLRSFRRLVGALVFSSLTQRILVLNLAGLGVLVSGILYVNQYREGLIDARVESLRTQGEIIAGAIAASASVETDSLRIDPEKLLELQAGQSVGPSGDGLDSLDFPINPERVAPVLRRLISPTRTRARIYDRDANLLLDSRHLYSGGQILRYGLPGLDAAEDTSLLDRIGDWLKRFMQRTDLPVDREEPGGSGAAYPEVMTALTGTGDRQVRVSEKGEMIVSVAVPIQRFRAVLGVLQLSTQGGDIDAIIASERKAILAVFGVAAVVTMLLSLLLASTIANPLRRLAAAAVRVKRGVKSREEIPDFSERQDEIGNLSTALRDMTNALYDRIDAIERFAADVSHELKNPLTSLRSAVETLPLARNEVSRDRLLEIIQHDVRRLDRLITDISDASRLDAELARADNRSVDMQKLLSDLVAASRETTRAGREARIDLRIVPASGNRRDFLVQGHDLRLGQVIANLISNARSFVPAENGHILVTLARSQRRVIVTVEDNGPGIRAENIERIFERFYTDRPASEAFGQNSGLGLSISRQIVEAHGGRLTAENIAGAKPGDIRGARFVVALPAEN